MPATAAVIGAGLAGIATAYALARRGVEVTLIERQAAPGLGASYANGAQLSWLYTDALASPRVLRQLPRLALGLDEAFRLKPSADPAFIRWLLQFLRNCTTARFRANTLASLELGLESRAAMYALLERHPIEFGYALRGKMQLYENAEAFRAARATMEAKVAHGAVQTALTPEQAALIEPSLASVVPRLAGVIYSPAEAVGDSHQFCLRLHAVLERDYGVTSHFGFDVARIENEAAGAIVLGSEGERVRADLAVLCSGADAVRLLQAHGHRPPIWPMKGYSFMAPPGSTPPAMSLSDTQRRLVFTRLGERVRIAGLAELGERSTQLNRERIAALVAAARASLPDAARYDEAADFWAGVRPMTPDSLPRIARPHPALGFNLGHGMLGWTLAMGTAERLAALVTNEPVS